MMKISLKGNRGTVLFMTLLILTSILVVTLGAANLIVPGIKMSRTQERSTKAYFAAEAGAERILWEVRREINYFEFKRGDGSSCITGDYINFDTIPVTCDNSGHSYSLSNNASYSIIYSAGPPITFTSEGAYLGTRRSVDVGYTD